MTTTHTLSVLVEDKPGVGVEHLLQAARLVLHHHVGQKQRKGLVADKFAGAPDRVPEAKRGLLTGEARLSGARQAVFQFGELGILAAPFQRRFKLDLLVEMVLDDSLVASGHENEMFDARFPGLVDHMLDDGPVDDGQHFLRHRFCRGKETCAKTGNGKYGFADGLHANSLKGGRSEGFETK